MAKEEKKIVTAEDILASYLKDNKSDHYNYVKEVHYRVPTGSLTLDILTGGGICPGMHRFCGVNEGGKSSAALELARNFIASVPKGRVMYIKSEGRLSKEMEARSGIKFVYSPEEWVAGNCFVFECNLYETVFALIIQLIRANQEENRYLFIVDSVDGLQRKADSIKAIGEAEKVAGGAVVCSLFMKRIALELQKMGHMCIMISQVRADIQLDSYSKEPTRQVTATGGNALLHWANWIWEFQPRFPTSDWILQDPSQKPHHVKNPIIGHRARIIVKKSPNETTGRKIEYPIKYGRTGGKSIWLEYELIEEMGKFGMIEKKASWIIIPPALIEELKKNKIEIVDKIQGEDNFRIYLEENPSLTEYLYNRFKKALGKTNAPA